MRKNVTIPRAFDWGRQKKTCESFVMESTKKWWRKMSTNGEPNWRGVHNFRGSFITSLEIFLCEYDGKISKLLKKNRIWSCFDIRAVCAMPENVAFQHDVAITRAKKTWLLTGASNYALLYLLFYINDGFLIHDVRTYVHFAFHTWCLTVCLLVCWRERVRSHLAWLPSLPRGRFRKFLLDVGVTELPSWSRFNW